MATSRAWTFASRGNPRSVLSLTSRPAPTLPPSSLYLSKTKSIPDREGGKEWLLIKVAYAALNPAGHLYITMIPAMARTKTAVPELDLSGTVADVWTPGSEPSAGEQSISSSVVKRPRFKKGDRVAAFIPVSIGWPTGTGALAEHVVLPARYVVPVPAHLSLRDASCAFTAGCTALMTIRSANLKKGDRVLVNGASGGIGTFAVQAIRDIVGDEGYVVAVCSGRNAEMVKGLRVDEVVDYTASPQVSNALKEKFGREGKMFDAVVDCIGVQDVYANCASYLVPEGVYAAVGIKPLSQTYGGFMKAVWTMQMNALWPSSPWLGGTGRRWIGTSMMNPERELMEEVMGMLADGRVKVVVDRELGFEEAVDGYDVVGSGRARGKIVVKVDGE
ncbi:zinc alcohol dehydrogenase [Colletotrichum truncatum]|uniref:Zinc alcohol dehydrogenase n=1 Tax=Colletotrichum truncatum TaxID=5467 RepID=A0ACC3ZHN7_COLTU|nr:zinc alcohol dehydrogenase [Colletotrichum truncatum]KAF6786630.1 zinc alcohol dehydrogenase [Colletotrichum truncatum]